MKYRLKQTSQFKKDYKLAKKQGKNLDSLKSIVKILENGKDLPESCQDHELKGNYKGYRECHIEPDWLLVYKKTETILLLTLFRTGSHSDLFK
ncbi:MAG: type II toxin-antitoxin system YafQ family toxin [Candidatus Riflebacteria bacterium]|nr:type II toxin-antitoxin system YafQ family toxin [Candidatus Riflebacteria bacterium]